MPDQYIQVSPDSTGKRLDTTQLVVSAVTVQRQRVQIAGDADVDLAAVTSLQPIHTTPALAVRLTPPVIKHLGAQLLLGPLANGIFIPSPGSGLCAEIIFANVTSNSTAAALSTIEWPLGVVAFTAASTTTRPTVITPAIPWRSPANTNISFNNLDATASQRISVIYQLVPA